MQPVMSVDDVATTQTLAHPMRLQILGALRRAASAAAVARALGEPRQKVNYHLKELERAGLVRQVGERRTGNFIENLYEAAARSFVVSPRVAWPDGQRAEALAAQVSLENLVRIGERLQRDSAELLDRAAFDGEQIASAAVEAQVRFADEHQRTEFLNAYLRAVGPLLARYGAASGEAYRMVLAVYPEQREPS
ncbi:MAG TPA: helix-turn-helix domain-containing protein [Euzebyales bacterium]|nr:helix-turn-helix domain-containing protein [Euzebyales bacterium]